MGGGLVAGDTRPVERCNKTVYTQTIQLVSPIRLQSNSIFMFLCVSGIQCYVMLGYVKLSWNKN